MTNLFMGKSMYSPFRYIGLNGDSMMLTIAGARTGKGTCAIIPNLLLWPHSTIVVDPKGENAYWTARYRRDVMGQDVHLIDPFNVVTQNTARINLADFIHPDSQSYKEDLQVIAEAMVVRSANSKDPHWDDIAEYMIAGGIDTITRSPKYPQPSLPLIRSLLTKMSDESSGNEMLIEMASLGGEAKETAERILRGLGTDEMSSLLSNFDKHTKWLSSDAVNTAITGASSFDFAQLKKKPTTVYIIIPAKYLEAHKRFLRLLINLAIRQISSDIAYEMSDKAKEIPVLAIIDEFLQLGAMAEVQKAFALMSGYNLILWPFMQDLESAQSLYGKGFNAFISNSRGVQIFGVSDPVTTEFVSKKLGKRGHMFSSLITGEKNHSLLRMPDEVEKEVSAGSGLQYILRNGKRPMLIKKTPYFKDRLFHGFDFYKGWDEAPSPVLELSSGDGSSHLLPEHQSFSQNHDR